LVPLSSKRLWRRLKREQLRGHRQLYGVIAQMTKNKGNLTELQCITRLYELGCAVSIPYGDSEKYDLIIDVNGHLYRLQCKHANPLYDENGIVEKIEISTTWQTGYTKNSPSVRHKYTKEDCDYFVTFYEGKTYLIPVDECSTTKYLRITPTKNNQKVGITFLKDYVDEEVLKIL